MAVVTVRTNSSARIALRDGFRVHTFSVGEKWTRTDATALHD